LLGGEVKNNIQIKIHNSRKNDCPRPKAEMILDEEMERKAKTPTSNKFKKSKGVSKEQTRG
jgi:hypothetical protein